MVPGCSGLFVGLLNKLFAGCVGVVVAVVPAGLFPNMELPVLVAVGLLVVAPCAGGLVVDAGVVVVELLKIPPPPVVLPPKIPPVPGVVVAGVVVAGVEVLPPKRGLLAV